MFTYDPSGNRISKSLVHAGDTLTTWYVRDAQGNVMSVYTYGDPAVNGKDLTQTELHVYGSSRLGIWNRSVNVEVLPPVLSSSIPLLGTGDSVIFTRGNKLFELSNHLGNVLATISDKRYGVSPNGSTVSYFNPEVVSANDYYPFGSLQPGRSYVESNAGNYRYGFNGQEKTDEIAGAGNHTTAEFWEYDPRIGRRWNVDPVNMGGKSPYAAFANNPIMFVDPLGLDTVSSSNKAKAGDVLQHQHGNSNFFWNKTATGWEGGGSSANLPTATVTAKKKSGMAGGLHWPNYSHQDVLRWDEERAKAFHRMEAELPLIYKGASEEYISLLSRYKTEYQAEQDGRKMQYGAVALTVGLPTLVYAGLELAPILNSQSLSSLTLQQLSDLAGSYSKPLNGIFNAVKARGLAQITAAEIEEAGATKEMLMIYRELATKYIDEIMTGAMKYTARGLAVQGERIEIIDTILKAFY